MSTPEQDIREGSVRVAIGDLLQSGAWDASKAMGYDPTAEEGTEKHIDVTLGNYSEDNPVPTMALRDVSEIAEGASGYSGFKANGDGPIQTFRGRIDVNTFVGTDDDLPENTQLLAKRIGLELRDVIHANANGVMDSATGEFLATDLACSRPRIGTDPDLPGPEFLARNELTYTVSEDPPNR